MHGASRARWLASSEVISQLLFTSAQPKKNKMASVSEGETLPMNEEAVPLPPPPQKKKKKKTQMSTQFGAAVLNGKLFSLSNLIFKYNALFTNKRHLTQPQKKCHRSNLTSACKSLICRQEGETELFTLFGQP